MKALFLSLLFAIYAISADAAIARKQATSANANTVAITSTTAGDVILVFAHRAGSTTAPSLPAGGGYTSLASTSVGTSSARLGYKISAGGDTSIGTWTNATQVVTIIYSGLNQTTPVTLNGNAIAAAAATTTLPFNTFTNGMTAAGTSWVAGFGAAQSATAGMNSNTTHLTSRTNLTTACGLDSGAAQASWSTESFTFTTSSNRLSIDVELLSAATAATNQFFLLF